MVSESVRYRPPPALRPLVAWYHLAREFRELAGCAPSRWLAEEFRNVQAGSPGMGEGSQHDR